MEPRTDLSLLQLTGGDYFSRERKKGVYSIALVSWVTYERREMLWHWQSVLLCGCRSSMEPSKEVQTDGGWSNWYYNAQEGLFL